MTFLKSIQTVYMKYFYFTGRAARSEYWWFTLFFWVVITSLYLLNKYFHAFPFIVLMYVFAYASVIPKFAVLTRRLHDINESGWWVFLCAAFTAAVKLSFFLTGGPGFLVIILSIISMIIGLVMIMCACKKGDNERNRFGDKPIG